MSTQDIKGIAAVAHLHNETTEKQNIEDDAEEKGAITSGRQSMRGRSEGGRTWSQN
jgi:hypothetical protein